MEPEAMGAAPPVKPPDRPFPAAKAIGLLRPGSPPPEILSAPTPLALSGTLPTRPGL